jgi:polyphenol oxidase
MTPSRFIEIFPALSAIPGLVHGFTLRSPGIDVLTDRDEALARLMPFFDEQLALAGVTREVLLTGEQVHGKQVSGLEGSSPCRRHFEATDGIMTNTAGQFLGVYVADCGAVLIADPVRRACAAVHSGRVGTELGIVPTAINRLTQFYGSDPADLIVQIAPCIRPPAYEVDFAATIKRDSVNAGVPAIQVIDCGTCTSSDPSRYYSYRIEKGKTGRHFAFIGWENS